MVERQRNSATTRSALLNAAADLISARGFDGTTTEAIAKRAHVNKAMISYHFGGKQGLYTAVLSEILTGMSVRLEAVRTWTATPEQRMTAFIAAFREMVRIQPAAPQLMLREAISGGRHVENSILPGFHRVFLVLQEILEQGTREGRFRPVNPVLTQIGLVGSLMFYFATETFRGRLARELHFENLPLGPEDYIRHWREMTLGGLAARGGGGAGMATEAELSRDAPNDVRPSATDPPRRSKQGDDS